MVPAGVSVATGHGNWNPSYFPKVAGLPPFACQEADAVTPAGIVRVACECVVVF
jgi:hypothetical protein